MGREVKVIGAGPAGSTAALAAAREGMRVALFEKSRLPRHKVCGEFLSPEAMLVFDRLGIADGFRALHPHSVRRATVRIGKSEKSWRLDEPALGVSRFALDQFLLDHAIAAGAKLYRETGHGADADTVRAHGRYSSGTKGNRLFGFKAHYRGPSTDAVELLFEGDLYVGVNSIENGLTNLCGIVAEHTLKRFNFEPDALVDSIPGLRERVAPLTRSLQWFITGPLVFGGRFGEDADDRTYMAGDALGFVDPFTGTGMLSAITTGYLAGRAVASGRSRDAYLRHCRELLQFQYFASSIFRHMISAGFAERLLCLLPGRALYKLTRPRMTRLG